MQSSVFFAKVIGPLFIIVAAGLLLNLKTYQKVGEEFSKSSALRYLGGFLALLLGLLMVQLHNVWEANWTVIITMIGWIGVVKGTVLLVVPDLVSRLSDIFTKTPVLLIVNSVLVFVLGIFLTVKGYWG